jgi:Mechanosensitive ion channel
LSILVSDSTGEAVKQTTENLHQITHSVLSMQSVTVLVISVGVALLLGRAVAHVLREVVLRIGKQADKSENLSTVNRLRRYETLIVLSIALIRTFLFAFAIYFWWLFAHPSGKAPALIGASALAVVVVSGALGPALRDLAAGAFMMTEQWYSVGDFIRLEPFSNMEGVVERVTLRSTRIRGLNGEIVWINNQYIQAVRLTPKGIRTLGLELFVDNLEAGETLIAKMNKRLPIGPMLVLNPVEIVSAEKVGDSLWHITAIGDTAPGREWLIEKSAVDLLKSLDEQSKRPTLAHGPLFRYADIDAERRFRRTITNARKRAKPKKRPTVKGVMPKQKRPAKKS